MDKLREANLFCFLLDADEALTEYIDNDTNSLNLNLNPNPNLNLKNALSLNLNPSLSLNLNTLFPGIDIEKCEKGIVELCGS